MRKLFTILFLAAVQLACLRAQDTRHQLEIIPDATGTAGELRFVETNGWTAGTGTNYVGFKPPASITTNFVMTLPAAAPGATSCVTVDTGGVIAFDPTCSGSGGLPVVDTTAIVKGSADPTKLLRFEVDGFTTGTTRVLTPQNADYTIAGTNISQTFTATQTFQNIFVDANLSRNIGATGTRFLNIFVGGFDASGQSFFQSGSTLGGDVIPSLNNNWDLGSATGGNIYATVNAVTVIGGKSGTAGELRVHSSTGSGSVTMSGTTDLTVDRNWRGDTNDLYTLGTSGVRWARLYTVDLNVSGQVETDLVPDTTNTRSLGITSTEWAQINTHHVAAGRPTVTTGDVIFAHSSLASTATLQGCSEGGTICIETTALIRPSVNNGRLLGTSSLRWSTVYSNAFDASSGGITSTGGITATGGIDTGTSSTSTVHIGSSGNFYTRDTGAASTGISCAGVGDGWLAVTSDNFVVWCHGGSRFRATGASF